MNVFKLLLLPLASLCVYSSAFGASFDCKKASTFAEKAICSDSLLNKLDETLSENYTAIFSSNIGEGARKDLKTTQRAWLTVRNKCSNNNCLVEQYKKRIDEICDYPVLSGAHPSCKMADEVEEELHDEAQPQTKTPPPQENAVRQEVTQKTAQKTANQIKQLKLPAAFVNSTIHVNYLGQWVEYMPCNKWLSLMLENKKIASIQGITAEGNHGVSVKRAGRPSVGILFRVEGKEAFITAISDGNKIIPIESPAEHSQMTMLVKSLTNEGMMD